MLSRFGLLAAAIALAGGWAHARPYPSICGTQPAGALEELHLHRQSVRARAAASAKEAVRRANDPIGRDEGEIAIMYSSGGVVARRNPFNLIKRAIVFTPSAPAAARYRFETRDSAYDPEAASSGTPIEGLDDDDNRRFPLPFAFPFFGTTYNDVYINSDGNLSFTRGDSGPTSRSLGFFAAGAPRIAVLFADLDPSRSRSGVRVLSSPSRFAVTWLEVPEYASFGTGPLQTFQVQLFPTGRIEFSYEQVTIRDLVAGIAPGGSAANLALVSFSTGSSQEFSAAVAERFSSSDALDTVLLAQRFYETHDDAYDYLAIYNTMDLSRDGSVASELTVRNRYRAGFGDLPVDTGAQYGSPSRLQAVLNMGPLSQYPRDPNGPVLARFGTGDTPLTVLAHEVGHLFLALVSIRDPANPRARPMLGGQLAHWAFPFNSEASFLEGNRIRDDGPGTSPRFTTVATVEAYSPLDQYLMGFRAPDEVPPTFLVRNSGQFNERLPQRGVSFNGERRDVTVEEIAAAEGRRSPDHTLAQRHFRIAFILVVPEGQEPRPEQLEQLETYRREFGPFYTRAADGRSTVDTTLKRHLRLSVFPAAGLTLGSTLETRLLLDRPADLPFTVALRAPGGAAGVPSEPLRFSAGARELRFPLLGLRAGVETLTAEPSDPRYAPAVARIQVAPSLSSVRLDVDGEVRPPQPLAIRATDVNLIPYPGLAIRAAVTGGGTVEPETAITDEDGIARFTWRVGGGPVNRLTATLAGAAQGVTVSAPGRPFFTAAGVVNAASYAPGLTPGGLHAIFGASLTGQAQPAAAAALPWPEVLAGAQVLLNGRPAQLYYAGEGQINFLAPRDLPAGRVELTVSTGLGATTVTLDAAAPMPGIFFNSATGEGAVLVAGTGTLTSVRPAAPGGFLEIYATGLGPVRPSAFEGLEETVEPPRVLLGGVALEVSFSGLSGTPGLYQINARIPAAAPSGRQKLVIEQGGRRSNEVDVFLR